MSTRCNIHFTGHYNVRANIYRHCDGYPSAMLPDLQEFFSDVKKQTQDTRFGDPSYLAAKFVVWQAQQFADEPSKPLKFISLGIATEDAGDGEYVYTVDCEHLTPEGFPTVTHRER